MRTLLCTTLALYFGLLAMPAAAQGDLTCKMSFNMSGWSAFYKTASGTGVVTCNNGQRLPVRITAEGGGLTVGKYKIQNGFGEFAEVGDVRDVIGSYVTAEAHAGTVKSASAQAMTNGKVSLALAGKGKGWDLGVAFSKFTIAAR